MITLFEEERIVFDSVFGLWTFLVGGGGGGGGIAVRLLMRKDFCTLVDTAPEGSNSVPPLSKASGMTTKPQPITRQIISETCI